MKALICPSLGPAENLKVMEVEAPVAGEGEVAGRRRLCGAQLLRHADHRGQVSGEGRRRRFRRAASSPAASSRWGRERGDFAVGDRVMGFCAYGAARGTDRDSRPIASPRIPDGLALDKAAGLSVAYGTTLHALKQRAEMKPGETLLVLGASGGVGLAAVEIGKAMGARVIAGASSDEKLAFARRYGAAETINTATDDLRARLKEHRPQGRRRRLRSGRRRADRSGAALARLEGAPPGDRLRLGRDSPAAAQHARCSRAATSAASTGANSPPASRKRIGENMAQLMDWAKSGALSVHIYAKYPLEDYRKAFEAIAKRQTLGKTLLSIDAAGAD